MLMYKKIIVPVVLYAEKKYNGLFTFGITTNCTLLTKDSIDFFANHNIGVLCSIDGAETTQCFNRPCKNGDNSFKLIEKNIKYLLTKIPNATFRSTAYPPTLKYTYQNYLYAESLGFRTYALCPDELSKWTNKDIKELKKQFNQIFLHQTKQQQIKENNYMKITSASSIQFMIDTLIMNRDFPEDSIFRCGLGVNTCAVGWDGKIYGCQQDVSLNKKNIMYLGTLEKGIQKKKHIKLLKKYLKDAKQIQYPRNYFQCHKCQLLPYCKNGTESGCPSTNLTLFKNSHKMSKIKCEFTKILFKEILLLKIISIQLSQQAKEE